MVYLGDILDKGGVQVDLKNIQAIKEGPFPQTLKSLRGFLGLLGYYRKFVNNYGKIASPLNLLKKNPIAWNEVVEQAFSNMKQAMCTTLVLAIPYFTKPFISEWDGLGTKLGVFWHRKGNPSPSLVLVVWQKMGKSTYEKEMMAIMHAIDT